jgi:hypothetical protein
MNKIKSKFTTIFIVMMLLVTMPSNGLAYEFLELEISCCSFEEKFEGAKHRPFVKEPTAVIMVEKDSVAPKGD